MVMVSVLKQEYDLVLQVAQRIASRTNSRVVVRSERLNVVEPHNPQVVDRSAELSRADVHESK